MTIFTGTSRIPFNIVVRIMDVFLYEKQKILYRISLGILKVMERDLLSKNGMERIMPQLKNFSGPVWLDEDTFFKLAFSISLTRKEIDVSYNI